MLIFEVGQVVRGRGWVGNEMPPWRRGQQTRPTEERTHLSEEELHISRSLDEESWEAINEEYFSIYISPVYEKQDYETTSLLPKSPTFSVRHSWFPP